MASADFHKCKGGTSAKAIFRHCATDTRLKNNHSNVHIDKAKTGQNLAIKVDNYAELCAAYDDRLKEVEKTNTNRRKDRVTAFSVNIPVPSDVPDNRVSEWCNKVIDLMEQQYGRVNVLGAFVHADEVHEYKDAETGQSRTSQRHMHSFFVPERDGQLNGKWASSRSNMVKLNKAIDRMSQDDFGCRFMTGAKQKSKKSVEQLKNESEIMAQDAMQEVQVLKERLAALIAQYEATDPDQEVLDWMHRYTVNKDGVSVSMDEAYKQYKADKVAQVRKVSNDVGKRCKTAPERIRKQPQPQLSPEERERKRYLDEGYSLYRAYKSKDPLGIRAMEDSFRTKYPDRDLKQAVRDYIHAERMRYLNAVSGQTEEDAKQVVPDLPGF